MRPLVVHTLTVVLVGGLVLTILGCGGVAVAVRAGVAPDFDQQIVFSAQHSLLIHNGRQTTCGGIPTLPQHDCLLPGPERRVFSVYYFTPHGVQVLVWFRLPE